MAGFFEKVDIAVPILVIPAVISLTLLAFFLFEDYYLKPRRLKKEKEAREGVTKVSRARVRNWKKETARRKKGKVKWV